MRLISATLFGILVAACGTDSTGDTGVIQIGNDVLELPALPGVAGPDVLGDLLAGKTIEQTPLLVDGELFLEFEIDGRKIYAQLGVAAGDVEGQALKPTAQKVRVTLTRIEDEFRDALRSVDSLMERMGTDPEDKIKVQGALAKMVVVGPGTESSPNELEINVSFLTPLYAPHGSCSEHWWWDACTDDTNGDACNFVAQVPCHAWTWGQEEIQITCEDGTVKPSIRYVLQSTQYFATLNVNGACGYLDFPWYDSNSDGCYCVVNAQPNCPAAPPPPQPPAPPNPCGPKTCPPKNKKMVVDGVETVVVTTECDTEIADDISVEQTQPDYEHQHDSPQ